MQNKTVKLFKIETPSEKDSNDENHNDGVNYIFSETLEDAKEKLSEFTDDVRAFVSSSDGVLEHLEKSGSRISVDDVQCLINSEFYKEEKVCNSCKKSDPILFRLDGSQNNIEICSECICNLIAEEGYLINLTEYPLAYKYEHIGYVFVDTGMIILSDPCCLIHTDHSEQFGYSWKDFIDSTMMFNPFVTQFGGDSGNTNHALVVKTSFGDGLYDVYGERENGGYTKIIIDIETPHCI